MIQALGKPFRLLIVGGLLLTLSIFMRANVVNAQTAAEQVCAGLGAAVGGDSTCTDPAGSESLDNTVASAINILSLVVGAVAVIMLIIGGLKYVSSQGDSSGIASAKNTIVYALVGLIIVSLAQVIVRFVVQRSNSDQTPALGGTIIDNNGSASEPAIPADADGGR